MPKTNAIPTVYKGVQFRSRLEAKWACFFDLCGWEWAYEPVDLPGYIPDFHIFRKEFVIGEGHKTVRTGPVMVEVKPLDAYDAVVGEKMLSACNARFQSGTHDRPGALLVLGNGPFLASRRYMGLGWAIDGGFVGSRIKAMKWHPAKFITWEADHVDYFEVMDLNNALIYGESHYIGAESDHVMETPIALWKQACNRVQWKGEQNDG